MHCSDALTFAATSGLKIFFIFFCTFELVLKFRVSTAISCFSFQHFNSNFEISSLNFTSTSQFRISISTSRFQHFNFNISISFFERNLAIHSCLAGSIGADIPELSSPELEEYYTLFRLAHIQSHDGDREINIIYRSTFFAWVSHPSSTPCLSSIPQITMGHIIQLAQAADHSFLHEQYPAARKMQRKVVVHVRPTNSGKTHHALCALQRPR